MIGFPKHLNSKADYLFVKDNFPSTQWEPAFQALLGERLQWFSKGKITNDGVTDATHRVVINELNGETEKYQYELTEDPNCDLLRLGFTVAEVESILVGDRNCNF